MKSLVGITALGALLVALPLGAEARPLHHHAKDKTAQAGLSRRAAIDSFSARMSRLDALMGIAPSARTRSASADH